MLALYHFGPVANSLTPLLCLIEKWLAFEDRFLDPRRWEHHAPAFRAVNPQGTVPVLVDDGRAITESTVINEYLDERFPDHPLRPADPWDRAAMRVWTKYVDEYVCPALTMIGAHGAAAFAARIDKAEMQARLDAMPDPEVRAKWARVSDGGYSETELADARTRLARVVARLEEGLDHDGDWILESGYSLADIKLFSMVPGLERMLPEECNATTSPRLHTWLRKMDARPAVQAMRTRDYNR